MEYVTREIAKIMDMVKSLYGKDIHGAKLDFTLMDLPNEISSKIYELSLPEFVFMYTDGYAVIKEDNTDLSKEDIEMLEQFHLEQLINQALDAGDKEAFYKITNKGTK